MIDQLTSQEQTPTDNRPGHQPRLGTAEIVLQKVGTGFGRARRAGNIPPDTPVWLSRAYSFDERSPFGKSLTPSGVWRLLEQDPSLEYKVENERVYVLSNGADLSLIVPKYRNIPEPYPGEMPGPLRLAFRLLVWAFLGLAPAGLGTLILAPLAAARAMRLYFEQPLSRANRVRVAIVLALAGGLLAVAVVLSYLFLLRL
jgi:hypothetical protein